MFCPHCGKEVADHQAFCQFCGSMLTEPASASGERTNTPWEDRSSSGLFQGLFKTLKASVFSPADFFKKMSLSGGIVDPLLYALICCMIGLTFRYVWQIALQGAMKDFMPPEMNAAVGSMFQSVGIAFLAVMAPLSVILWQFVLAGLLHLILMMVRGANRNFEATFRAVSYSTGPALFMVIPFCGDFIAGLWTVIMIIIGLKEAHATTGGKAAFAVLFPLILCCGLMALAFLFFMGAVVAAFSAMVHP